MTRRVLGRAGLWDPGGAFHQASVLISPVAPHWERQSQGLFPIAAGQQAQE